MTRGSRARGPSEAGPRAKDRELQSGVTTATGLPRRVHCVGVSGGGLSGLARLLLHCGHLVSGSDRAGVHPALERAGLRSATFAGSGPSAEADLLVRSAAVPDHDPELLAARAAGVPVLKYAQALGRVMSTRRGVAVAGTHGKTTTTALLACLCHAAGTEPSWLVGGTPRGLPSFGWGQGEWMLVEACEYDRSFLQLHYEVALVTGVAADHLDCFGDLAGVRRAFAEFTDRLPPGGLLLLGPGVPRAWVFDTAPGVAVRRADECLRLERTRADERGWRLTLREPGGTGFETRFRPWGRHNLDNLLCGLGVARHLGLELETCARLLPGFGGVARRLTDCGEVPWPGGGSVRLVDDFAHHPDALRAAAGSLREHLPGRRLVGLFQPHQVSRTESLMDDFAQALQAFDAVGLCDIFVARDDGPERADAVLEQLARRCGDRARRLGPADRASEAACDLLRAGDACVIMGAGDVDRLARRLGGTPAGA